MNALFLILSVMIGLDSFSQERIRSRDLPQVIENDIALKNAWAGGLNSPQFNQLDINYDGLLDLFVFDRHGDRKMLFENMGNGSYHFTRAFNNQLPAGLDNWVVTRDFNCDGRMDIATNSQSGFVLFFNIGNAQNGMNWEQLQTPNFNNLVMAEYDFSNDPFTAPIYSLSIDIPSFTDHDDDGDIDLFTFTELSNTVYYYKNMAVENGNCTVPAFECVNRCYGYFSESVESFDMFFGDEAECQFNVIDPRSFRPEDLESSNRLHAGGTMLQIDLDNNGIDDLILSDVTESNMGALLMTNSTENRDSVATVQFDFPLNNGSSEPVNMSVFPAGYYLDLDGDGTKELLVSPNTSSESEDRFSVWHYSNDGQNDLPLFELTSTRFLQEEMIDVGTNASPCFEDLNYDGLVDLVVANRRHSTPDNSFSSKLRYYRNIGSNEVPVFELIDDNYLNIPSFQWRSIYPAFADLDADGDRELLLGDLDGVIHVFYNSNNGIGESQFSAPPVLLTNNTNQNIDVGQSSTPQVLDYDEDGLLDLMIGEKNGNINFYRNIGTTQNAIFELMEDTVGDVLATSFLGVDGFSVPLFFKNDQAQWELLVGSETGQLGYYDAPYSLIFESYNFLAEDYFGDVEGTRTAVAMRDITNDGITEIAVGLVGGGIAMHLSEDLTVRVNELSMEKAWSLFPNPVQRGRNYCISRDVSFPTTLEIFDVAGKRIMQTSISGEKAFIPAPMDSGTYFIRIQGQTGVMLVY